MRYQITDELWAVMEPLVRKAKRCRRGPKPKVPDRPFFEALLYLARSGIPWRDLPAEFGEWDAVYNRFRRFEIESRRGIVGDGCGGVPGAESGGAILLQGKTVSPSRDSRLVMRS